MEHGMRYAFAFAPSNSRYKAMIYLPLLACRVPDCLSRLGQNGTDAAHTQCFHPDPHHLYLPSSNEDNLSVRNQQKRKVKTPCHLQRFFGFFG